MMAGVMCWCQVLAVCFIRKALDWLFTRHELKWLDDIMPESHKREKEEKKKKMNQALSYSAVCRHHYCDKCKNGIQGGPKK